MELSDSHMHTPLCGHAVGMPVEYVEAAAKMGLRRITFTCHQPFDEPLFGGPRIRMSEEALPLYWDLVAEARERGASLGVEVLTGIEAEISPRPDVQAALGEILAGQPFDFVLGSLHHQLDAYHVVLQEEGRADSDGRIIEHYFQTLATAARSRRFHSLSHPDVIRLYGTLWGAFKPARHEAVIKEAITAAVEHGVCWEINTSGRNKGDYVEHPDPLIRRWGIEAGLRFTLGSDAHRPGQVGMHFREILADAQREGLTAYTYFRGGQPIEVPLAAGGLAD